MMLTQFQIKTGGIYFDPILNFLELFTELAVFIVTQTEQNHQKVSEQDSWFQKKTIQLAYFLIFPLPQWKCIFFIVIYALGVIIKYKFNIYFTAVHYLHGSLIVL